jgi:hypothetical protein
MESDSLHFFKRPKGYYTTVILMSVFFIIIFLTIILKLYYLTVFSTVFFLICGIYGLWKYERGRPKHSESAPLSWIFSSSFFLIIGIVLLFIEEFPQDKRYAVLPISLGIAGISYGLYRYFMRKAGKPIIITTSIAVFLLNAIVWIHHFTVRFPAQIERESNYAKERKKIEENMKKESEKFERLMEDPLREILEIRLKEKYGISIPDDFDWSKIDTSDHPVPVVF